MSLIIATGTNQGDRKKNLEVAVTELCNHFSLIAQSRIYHSEAVDYEDQPDFYNQVLEFELPTKISPDIIMDTLLEIELSLGRIRNPSQSYKGPRIIDLDILFYALETHPGPKAIIPHPRLFERSFVVLPLMELPYFLELKKTFTFKTDLDNFAKLI